MEDGLEGPDLLQEPVGQLLAGADGQTRNVVDRLLGVKLGALAARPVENIDDMGLEPRQPKLEGGKQAHRSRANNDDFGGSLVGLHRSPAGNAAIVAIKAGQITRKPFCSEGYMGEKEETCSMLSKVGEFFFHFHGVTHAKSAFSGWGAKTFFPRG